tara:strand:+ start:2288 stop:3058 length:771 start_codon:yes stop_codon:yes gene_type:complete
MMANAEFFRNNGYLTGLQVFDAENGGHLVAVYERLKSLLPFGEPTERMDWWHVRDKELWDICTHSSILDLVEEILGPDFFLWGSQYFCKDPGDSKTVPWHQDAFYWPLSPQHSITVWLAVMDVDEENAAMRILPRTHKTQLSHAPTRQNTDVLESGVDICNIDESTAVSMVLKSGQISIHDDRLAHGSGPNTSTRPRLGLAMRFSAGNVKCDMDVWPFFRAYWCRGHDHWRHNPIGIPPSTDMIEFENITPRTGER